MYAKKIARFLKSFSKSKKLTFFLLFVLLVFFTVLVNTPRLLIYFEKLYNQEFVFFSVGEPITSILRFAFFMTVLIIFPFLWYFLIAFVNFVFPLRKRFFYLFFFSGVLLFYTGVVFAYEVTLPYGIKFLLSFGNEKVEPAISLKHFVNFFGFFLIAFGFIFEMPLFICFLCLIKIVSPEKLGRYRKEVFFIIVVLAAIITPTPDAFNMALLAVPLYILFELGLLLSKVLLRTNTFLEEPQKGPQIEQQPSQGA
jgi:sec-independent protein translocase protein TatC